MCVHRSIHGAAGERGRGLRGRVRGARSGQTCPGRGAGCEPRGSPKACPVFFFLSELEWIYHGEGADSTAPHVGASDLEEAAAPPQALAPFPASPAGVWTSISRGWMATSPWPPTARPRVGMLRVGEDGGEPGGGGRAGPAAGGWKGLTPPLPPPQPPACRRFPLEVSLGKPSLLFPTFPQSTALKCRSTNKLAAKKAPILSRARPIQYFTRVCFVITARLVATCPAGQQPAPPRAPPRPAPRTPLPLSKASAGEGGNKPKIQNHYQKQNLPVQTLPGAFCSEPRSQRLPPDSPPRPHTAASPLPLRSPSPS